MTTIKATDAIACSMESICITLCLSESSYLVSYHSSWDMELTLVEILLNGLRICDSLSFFVLIHKTLCVNS